MELKEVKVVIEALLLASDVPLSEKKISSILDNNLDKKIVLNCLIDIQNEWEEKGLELVSTSLGWRFQTKRELSTFIQKLQPEKSIRYSRAMMETLAIIAYRQPVTRADIESIRGVNVSSQIIRNLEEKNWIECVGQKEVLGKPWLYATTKSFLADLGLRSLNELPPIPSEKTETGSSNEDEILI